MAEEELRLNSPVIEGISIVFTLLNDISGSIFIVWIFLTCSRYIHNIIRRNFISNKPSFFTLYYSFATEILIFITSNWWFIKGCILNSITSNSHPLHRFFGMWCMCWLLWILCNCHNAVRGSTCQDICFVDCCILCHHKHDGKSYLKREYWQTLPRAKYDSISPSILWLLLIYGLNYGLTLLFGCLYYQSITNNNSGVYAFVWNGHEYWAIVAVIVSKCVSQLLYANGKPYDKIQEDEELKRRQMRMDNTEKWNLLRFEIGDDLTQIIFEYADEFEICMRVKRKYDCSTLLTCCGCTQNQHEFLYVQINSH